MPTGSTPVCRRGDFGFKQSIRIGPMSGRSNVVFWLESRGHEPTEERVERIIAAAKGSKRLLEDADILALVQGGTGRG